MANDISADGKGWKCAHMVGLSFLCFSHCHENMPWAAPHSRKIRDTERWTTPVNLKTHSLTQGQLTHRCMRKTNTYCDMYLKCLWLLVTQHYNGNGCWLRHMLIPFFSYMLLYSMGELCLGSRPSGTSRISWKGRVLKRLSLYPLTLHQTWKYQCSINLGLVPWEILPGTLNPIYAWWSSWTWAFPVTRL